MGLRVHVVLRGTQDAPGLLDLLVLLDVPGKTESASKEPKETEEFLEGEEPKVLLVVVVLLVLLVPDLKEIKDVKELKETRDLLVLLDILETEAVWAEMDHRVLLDIKD